MLSAEVVISISRVKFAATCMVALGFNGIVNTVKVMSRQSCAGLVPKQSISTCAHFFYQKLTTALFE